MQDHLGFFVIPLLSHLWEEKNYCEKRNEHSSWRPVALPNHHIYLCLFKQGYDVNVLLSSVMYILSGEYITAVYTMSRRRWDQNTTQVANRLDRTRAIYVWLLHLTPWVFWSHPRRDIVILWYLSLLSISPLSLIFHTLSSLMPGVENFCRTALWYSKWRAGVLLGQKE